MQNPSKSDLKQESDLYSETQVDLATDCNGVRISMHFIVAEYCSCALLGACACISTGRKYVSNNEMQNDNPRIGSALHLES